MLYGPILLRCFHFLIFTLFLFAGMHSAYAGELLQRYESYSAQTPEASSAALYSQALDERLKAEESSLYPSVSLDIAQVRRKESFSDNNTATTGQSGSQTFGNSRRSLRLKQPIYDSELSGNVAVAKIMAENSGQYVDLERESGITTIFEDYIDAAMYKVINDSYQRSIDRINRELKATEKKFKYKLVTVHELDTMRLHLLNLSKNLKFHRSKFENLLDRLNSGQAVEKLLVVGKLKDDVDLGQALVSDDNVKQYTLTNDIVSLQTEIKRHEQEIKNEKASRLPRLNFVMSYEFDNAPEKVISNENDVSNYELGVVMEWDIFNGGKSYHKVSEARYMAQSKRILLNKKLQQQAGKYLELRKNFEHSNQLLADEAQILSHRLTVRDAMEKGFQGGTETFLATIDSVLLHEESLRNYERARYTVVKNYVALKSHSTGLLRDDAVVIDGLFN